MDKIDLLEEKIKAAARTIERLREAHGKAQDNYRKLEEENELLHSENKQVRKLITELDRLREERKVVKQKCDKLLARLQKTRI